MADGYWEDVGTLEAYLQSHQDILDQQVQVDINGFQLRPGVWLGKGAEIDPSVVIDGPAVIGDNCVIGPGARLGQYCTLGRNVRIGDNAVLQRSVVHDNTYLGSGVRIDGQRARPGLRPAPGGPVRGGGGPRATSASWGPTPRSRPG